MITINNIESPLVSVEWLNNNAAVSNLIVLMQRLIRLLMIIQLEYPTLDSLT